MTPDRFGDYVVTGSLGQGAMGVVMRARHVGLGVDRALKVLSQVTPERLVRFEREGRTLAEIRHPNVVAVHETGVRDGRPWFVMDLVEGRPLDELLRAAGRLPVAQVLSLGAGLARGLAALHASGVIHRDLKPSNVLVRTDGSPVIVDLGVALAPESEHDRLTRTGALVGTLTYMAPEQLVGERATKASDVYALGAILFEAACGTPAAPEAGSLQEFIMRVVDGPTPRVGDVDPDLPAALDRLLVRAMAKGPAGRPSAAELAAGLEAPGVLTSGRARARQRSKVGVALGATLLLAVSAGALVLAGPLHEPVAAVEPTPPPSEAPVVSIAPAVDPFEVTRQLERALVLPEPLARRRALATWLRANPGQPRAAQALDAWRKTLREAPLAVWSLAPGKRVHGLLLADGRALGWVRGEAGLSLADPWTGAVEVVAEAGQATFVSAEHDPRGGELLADDRGRLHGFGTPDVTVERDRSRDVVRAMAITARHIAVVRPKFVFVVDRETDETIKVGPFENPREVALTDDDRVLVVATAPTPQLESSWLFSVDLARKDERLISQAMGARISVLGAAADGQVLTALTSGIILLLDARTGLERGRFVSPDVQRRGLGLDQNTLAHDVAVCAGVFVDGGRRLVSAGGNLDGGQGDLRCWDVASGRELAPPLRFAASCVGLDVARDERTILVAFDSGNLEVWAAPHRVAELDVDRSARVTRR